MSRDCVKLEFICLDDFRSLGGNSIKDLKVLDALTPTETKKVVKFICNLFWISRVDWLCDFIAWDTTPYLLPFRTGVQATFQLFLNIFSFCLS